MIAVGDEWVWRARRLADELRAHGDVRSTAWYAALAEVPRHVLVPRAYEQDTGGRWAEFDTSAALGRVYSPETLITAVGHLGGHEVAVSSSTKPDLVVRMLEILEIGDGHRVLEIGTGSGYNAALLTHRLGDERVFSVEIDADLVRLARERLAALGYRPTLVVADGIAGLAQHAPFDRIVATCSVRTVPWSWAVQLAADGAILVDLKLAVSAGNLVCLRRRGDCLDGRFTRRWAGFMAMRHVEQPIPERSADLATAIRRRMTDAPTRPWIEAPLVWFLAHRELPSGVVSGLELDPTTRQPAASTLSAPDGSWARIDLTDRVVTEAGESPLWISVERAHRLWDSLGRPGWDRFGLTVSPDGTHRVWLDDPASSHRWNLPQAS